VDIVNNLREAPFQLPTCSNMSLEKAELSAMQRRLPKEGTIRARRSNPSASKLTRECGRSVQCRVVMRAQNTMPGERQSDVPGPIIAELFHNPELCSSTPVRHIRGIVSSGIIVREESCAFTDRTDHFLSH